MRYRYCHLFLPSLYWGFPKLQSVTHLRWLLPLIPADPHCLGGVTPVWFGMVSYLIVWYADPLCLGGITPGPANTGERDHRQQKIFLYGRYFFIPRLFSFPHHSKSCLLQYEVTWQSHHHGHLAHLKMASFLHCGVLSLARQLEAQIRDTRLETH